MTELPVGPVGTTAGVPSPMDQGVRWSRAVLGARPAHRQVLLSGGSGGGRRIFPWLSFGQRGPRQAALPIRPSP